MPPEKYPITIPQDVKVSVDIEDDGEGGTGKISNPGMIEEEETHSILTPTTLNPFFVVDQFTFSFSPFPSELFDSFSLSTTFAIFSYIIFASFILPL